MKDKNEELFFDVMQIIFDHIDCNIVQATETSKKIVELYEIHEYESGEEVEKPIQNNN